MWLQGQNPYSIWQAHTPMCTQANSDSWVSCLIDWLIDQQIKQWKKKTQTCSHYLRWDCLAVVSLNMGSRIPFDRDFQGSSQRAGTYLCSMWLPALLCFSNTVNGSFCLTIWEVMCKRESGHANAKHPYSSPDWLLSVSLRCRLFCLLLWKIMCHCYANSMWCLCKEWFGSFEFTLSYLLHNVLCAQTGFNSFINVPNEFCCGDRTQQKHTRF